MTEPTSTLSAEIPDCTECAHYFITHDASFPYGCRAQNFKSKRKPQQDVMEASGNVCLTFEMRVRTDKF